MPFKNFYSEADIKAVRDNAALNLEWLLKDTSTRPEIDAALSKSLPRGVIKNALMMHNPGIELTTFRLCEAEREYEAVALVEGALTDLFQADPILFAPCPTREQMMALAIEVIHDGRASEQQRRSLWPTFCDRGDEHRLRDGYKFRHEIAARGAAKPSPKSPEVLSDAHDGPRSGLIDGGHGARARVAGALDAANFTPAPAEEDIGHLPVEEGAEA